VDEIDQLLESIIGGTPPSVATSQYLNSLLGIQPEQKAFPQGGHSATGAYSGARPDYTPDENGYIHGRAATFATQGDLNNFAQTGSLATGDNGVGAFGHRTSVLPGVAIARDVLQRVYGSTAAANGKTVEVVSPNGTVANLPILDVGPASRNARNNSVLELTPAATQILGSADMGGYRYKFNF
jgi:hypothetical protein